MATRASITNKFYLDAAGERTNSPTDAVAQLGFEFYTGEKDADGKNIVGTTTMIDLSSFSENVCRQAMAHGFAQKIGDEYAGKGDQAEEIVDTMVERLQGGEWNTPRGAGSGPRPSMVFDAVIAVLTANGVDITDELRAEVLASLATDGARKSALEDASVRAEYEGLRAKAAADRAKAAADAAKKATDGPSFLDAFKS